MKNYYKFFYIFLVVSLIIFIFKESINYIKKEKVQKDFLVLQCDSLMEFINSFREVYQSNFLKYQININDKTIHLLPINTISPILKQFSKKIDGNVEMSLILNEKSSTTHILNVRNPSKNDEKIINYFETHKKQKKLFFEENGYFVYYKPIYVKPNIYKKIYHSKIKLCKTGELKGIIKIKVFDSKFIHLINQHFYNRFIMDLILYILTLTIIWILIKNIEQEDKKNTKKLLNINRQLQIEKEKAQKNAKAKSEFLANMSHEIRTPLNAMFGFVSILQDKNLDEESKKYLDIIEKSGHILLNVINDILDFSKIESNKLEVEKIPFDLKNEIELIYHLFETKASERNINLYIKESNIDKQIISDPTRLKQIISNLLSNAIKFTPPGKNIYLTINYDEKNEELFIEVKDEGIGIENSKLETIFKPFSQEDNSTTRKYGGSGLGLTISYKLVNLLGGKLKVKSQKNNGSIFYFLIPAKTTKMKIKKTIKPDEKFNYKVLMVEDNKANQMFLGVLLKKLNITYEIANDGIEAIEKFKQNRYDLILMDENMPNMSGSEATKNIREYEKENNLTPIFIIAVTANALSGDREKFLKVGMNEYISKPIDIEKLKKIFRSFNEYNNNRSK